MHKVYAVIAEGINKVEIAVLREEVETAIKEPDHLIVANFQFDIKVLDLDAIPPMSTELTQQIRDKIVCAIDPTTI
jgi:hypothetical protein